LVCYPEKREINDANDFIFYNTNGDGMTNEKYLNFLLMVGGGSQAGILDTYTGASAAYSLRKLSSDYSGDAIIVTTNGTDSQSIGFVGNELDTATLESFAGSGDAYVSTWHDQSGNGRDFTQSTFANMPKIVSSGSTITQNSKPIVEFDGSTRYMDISSQQTFTDEFFMTFAIRPTSNANAFGSLLNGQGTAQNRVLVYENTTTSIRIAGTSYTQALGWDIGTYTNYTIERGSTDDIKQYFYGTIHETDNDANDWPVLFRVGGNKNLDAIQSLHAQVSEMIFWNTDESSNRVGIESNIRSFYSIGSSAPSQPQADINSFVSRVETDGGSVLGGSCLLTDVTFLTTNP
jgi:hypothetical protein